MTRYAASALAFATTVAAAVAAAAVLSSNAYADDITIDNTPFVSTLTRAQVNAELNVPYAGGNPWGGRYNMFQIKSTSTSEQVQSQYKMSRDEVNALTGEDSGSAYFFKSATRSGASPTSTMGAPAR